VSDANLPGAIACALEELETEKRAWSKDWAGGFAFRELPRDSRVWNAVEEVFAQFDVKAFVRPAPAWRAELAESLFPAHWRRALPSAVTERIERVVSLLEQVVGAGDGVWQLTTVPNRQVDARTLEWLHAVATDDFEEMEQLVATREPDPPARPLFTRDWVFETAEKRFLLSAEWEPV
jgi:hypothetical protein